MSNGTARVLVCWVGLVLIVGPALGQRGPNPPGTLTPTEGCGTPGSGDCLQANGTPYCENQTCCEAVCGLDSYCCTTEWDAECASLATSLPTECSDPGNTPEITITSPDGGEVWTAGTTQSITWTSANTTGDEPILVHLYKGEAYIEALGETTVGAGSISWPISIWIGDDTDYRICAEAWVDGLGWVEDCSDAAFTITGSLVPPTLMLTSPDGGEDWSAGTTHSVTWSSSGTNGDEWLTVNLYEGETPRGQIGGTTVGTGSLDWSISPWIGDGTDYSICVEVGVDGFGLLQDCSDAPFAISDSLEPPTIAVTSPDGGESWAAGTTQSITWSSTNTAGTEWATVSLYEGAVHRMDVGSGPLAAGSLEWQISSWIGDSTDYRICIETWVDNYGVLQDCSDAPFTITDSTDPPTATVLTPNGGEVWQAGTTQSVTWTSTQTSGDEWVTVSLFAGGINVRQIGGTLIGDGGLDWAIPAWVGDGTDYRVCLESWVGDFGVVTDCSDTPFTITGSTNPPTVTLLSPNGGEVWPAGATQAITGTRTNTTGNEWLAIDLYDADEYYGSVGGATLGSGSFNWQIPSWTPDSASYRVRIVLYDNSESFEDYGDGVFSITGSTGPPSIAVTSPNGGEEWSAGSTQAITWSSTGIPAESYVSIALYENGAYRAQIGSALAGDGTVDWAISAWIGDRSDYQVCLDTWVAGIGQVQDCSDAFFSITGSTPPPTVTVTSPNGGEVWQAGSTHAVTWTTTGTAGDEWIGASLYAGAEYLREIGSAPAGAGSITWQIPLWVGNRTNYRVRLSMSSGFDLFQDDSNAPFTITGSTGAPTFTILAPNGGEVWSAGTERTISWTSTNTVGHELVSLELYQGAEPRGTIGAVAVGDGSFTWSISPWIGDRSDYRVRVVLYDSGSAAGFEDYSNAPFTIADSMDPPTITVTSPASEDVWQAGTTQAITWTSTDTGGWVMVFLYSETVEATADPASWRPTQESPLLIGLAPMADGSLDWSICSSLSSDAGYRIEIMWMLEGTVRGLMDGPFEIVNAAPGDSPSFTLDAPQPGQIVQAGTTVPITWTSTDPVGNVDFYLSHFQSALHLEPEPVRYLGSAAMAAGQFDWEVDPALDWTQGTLTMVSPCALPAFSDVQILPVPGAVFVTSATSRRTHGLAGTFSIPLPVGSSAGVECRMGGPTLVVLTFNGLADGAQVQASAGTVGAVTVDGSQVTVELSGVPDGTCLTLTASGVEGMEEDSLVHIACLAGELTGDGAVNVLDLVQVRNRLNQTASASNFRADVNADGTINVLDLVSVRNNLNASLTCP